MVLSELNARTHAGRQAGYNGAVAGAAADALRRVAADAGQEDGTHPHARVEEHDGQPQRVPT